LPAGTAAIDQLPGAFTLPEVREYDAPLKATPVSVATTPLLLGGGCGSSKRTPPLRLVRATLMVMPEMREAVPGTTKAVAVDDQKPGLAAVMVYGPPESGAGIPLIE
jgi:hypothetical protein